MGKEVLHDVTVTWVCEACGGKAVKTCSDKYFMEPEVPEGWTTIVCIHPKQKVEFTTGQEVVEHPPHPSTVHFFRIIKSEDDFRKLLICPECWQKLKSGEIWKRELPKKEEKPLGFFGRKLSDWFK